MISQSKIKVSFWGVRCWYDTETTDLIGINWLHDMMIPVAVLFQDTMTMITQFFNSEFENPGFRFKVIK